MPRCMRSRPVFACVSVPFYALFMQFLAVLGFRTPFPVASSPKTATERAEMHGNGRGAGGKWRVRGATGHRALHWHALRDTLGQVEGLELLFRPQVGGF